MTIPGDFASRVEERVRGAERVRREEAGTLAASMAGRERLQAAFDRAADAVHNAVVRPRVEALARQLTGSAVSHRATPAGMHSECSVPRSERVRASATLRMGIALDAARATAVLSYSVEITPVLMRFERGDRLEWPVEDGTVPETATVWVEERLLRFLDSYLAAERHPLYQRENVHADPVCGMAVPGRAAVERAIHEGKAYYFCSPGCRERFLANPRLFIRGVAELP